VYRNHGWGDGRQEELWKQAGGGAMGAVAASSLIFLGRVAESASCRLYMCRCCSAGTPSS